MIELLYKGVNYEVLTKTCQFSGVELFKVRNTDVWVAGSPERAVKYYIKVSNYDYQTGKDKTKKT